MFKILTKTALLSLLGTAVFSPVYAAGVVPADKFDLSEWKITLPIDRDRDGKVDEIGVKQIQKYSLPPFFFVSEAGYMVFTAPNKATTTSGSSNSRSELRHMLRGKKTRIGTHDPGNNFSLKSHSKSKKFAQVGGKLEATLMVNHVAKNAKYPNKFPAYSVVVGQIHADKDKRVLKQGDGFGWGNEPIKIYYKKWPDHKTGSVFWTYERNLAKTDPNRIDIAYPVWGNTWENPENPGAKGLVLGEKFSYTINVYKDIMYLTFETANQETVKYEINLANNVDAYGKVDEKDHPYGYLGDALYFKAGAYDQCSVKDDPGFWYPACAGTGKWEIDSVNGDYTSVAFSMLKTSKGEKPKKD